MKIRDWFIIVFSTLVGFFAGMYLYVTSFAPVYQERDFFAERSVQDVGEFDIIGVQYGGNFPVDYNHPSFRIGADGSYGYFPGGLERPERVDGNLPRDLRRVIAEAMLATDFASASTLSDQDCSGPFGGTNYEYNIDYEGTEYELDTCATNFAQDSELGEALGEVWQYLESPETFTLSIRNYPADAASTSETTAETETEIEYVRPAWTLGGYFERGFKEAGFGNDDEE